VDAILSHPIYSSLVPSNPSATFWLLPMEILIE